MFTMMGHLPNMMRHNENRCACPEADIKETKNEYVISLEIPGAMKDDVKIWVEEDTLTVSGEKKRSSADSDKEIFSDRAFGKFERSFTLGDGVERNNIKAEFVNGVLEITIPKAPQSKPVEISIN